MEFYNQLWLLDLTKNVRRAYVKDAIKKKPDGTDNSTIVQMMRIVCIHRPTGEMYCLMSDSTHMMYVKFAPGPAMTRYQEQFEVPLNFRSTHMLVEITSAHLRQYLYTKLMKALLFEVDQSLVRYTTDMVARFNKALNYVVLEVEDFRIFQRLGIRPQSPFRTFVYLEPNYQGRIDFSEAKQQVDDDEEGLLEEGNASTYQTVAYPTVGRGIDDHAIVNERYQNNDGMDNHDDGIVIL